ncbi:MAG: tyrosine-type recombinase/integrase [bacterium]
MAYFEDPRRPPSSLKPQTISTPRKTLPRLTEDEHVRKLLVACQDTFEGRRNRALIAVLADSGLRISEVLRLRLEDVNTRFY